MRKHVVTLTRDERDSLSEIASKGKHPSQKVLNQYLANSPPLENSKVASPHSEYQTGALNTKISVTGLNTFLIPSQTSIRN